jgi:hypothetical protein
MVSTTAPLAFITVEALLLIAGGLAAVGAAASVIVVRQARRRRASGAQLAGRRAPSPSSVGLAEDPIVAALRAHAADPRRRQSPRRVDPVDPPA